MGSHNFGAGTNCPETQNVFDSTRSEYGSLAALRFSRKTSGCARQCSGAWRRPPSTPAGPPGHGAGMGVLFDRAPMSAFMQVLIST